MTDPPPSSRRASGTRLDSGGQAVSTPTRHGAVDDDPTGRLAAYLARTQGALDLLALTTLWIVVVPVADFTNRHDLRGFALGVRIALSLIYGIDMAVRCALAPHHWRYLRGHPLGALAVLVPPVRVLFSLRLIRALFRRGNLDRFLIAALFLLVNGALIVFMFERSAEGANIDTFGESIWWAVVTATTVGYGDYYPVTIQGQVVAAFIMLIGIVTAAVITAQVASSFVDQSAGRNVQAAREAITGGGGPDEVAGRAVVTVGAAADELAPLSPPTVTLAELDARLSRIEQLLMSLQPRGGEPTGDITD